MKATRPLCCPSHEAARHRRRAQAPCLRCHNLPGPQLRHLRGGAGASLRKGAPRGIQPVKSVCPPSLPTVLPMASEEAFPKQPTPGGHPTVPEPLFNKGWRR